MLRDLKPGATIHILNLKDLSVSTASVMQTTHPVPQLNLQVTSQGVMPPRQLMSISVKWNGNESVFNNLCADLSSSESSDGSGLVVCETEDALTDEMRSAMAKFDSLIENQPYFHKAKDWLCDQLAMRDPVKKAELQNAKQVEAIKKEFGGIISEQNAKIDELTSVVSQLTTLLQQSSATKKGKE